MPDSAARAESSPRYAASSKPVAVVRRLPGKARPREDALREYQDFNAKRRSHVPAVLWAFVAPDPDKFYRWRVQLECGCITEILTWGNEQLPTQGEMLDAVSTTRLPAGQLLCLHDDAPPAPYREITEWGERREVAFPADPTEPPDWATPEMWAAMRHDEPHSKAFWNVTLSCGHVTEVVAPNLQWKPVDGPNRASAKKLKLMTAAYEELWASDPDFQDEQQREHTKRILADGWPLPRPEERCTTCRWAQWIVAYQRVGWLVPPKAEPKRPKPPSRESVQRRLRQAEKEAKQLREQLADLDEESASGENN